MADPFPHVGDGGCPVDRRRKPRERALARDLRRNGWSVPRISRELGVSKSSVSRWVADLPKLETLLGPEREAERRKRAAETFRERVVKPRQARVDERRQEVHALAAAQVTRLDAEAVMACFAILYWAEGSKDKPYERRERVVFANSDLRLVAVFIHMLGLLGVDETHVRFRLQVHETADVEGIQKRWADELGIDATRFSSPTIKRHRPRTNRLNVGSEYRGVLVVSVVQSADLYRRIHGWFLGTVESILRVEALGEVSAPAWKD
jgi:predicted transcriptional regulator